MCSRVITHQGAQSDLLNSAGAVRVPSVEPCSGTKLNSALGANKVGMAMNELTGFDLLENVIHLSADGAASNIAIDEGFWGKIGDREELHEGRLMGAFRIIDDPDHWEAHPAGEEILFLISGSMDVVLKQDGKEHVVQLRDRGACIVPRGVWHRQVIHRPSEFVFVTPGKDTQRKPV